MQQFFEFVIHHWYLWVLLLLVVGLLLKEEISSTVSGTAALSPQDATLKINHENAIMVDVRDPEAFAKNHIIGSLNIPASELKETTKKLAKYKQKPIIMVCEAGVSSARIASKLKNEGFTQVYSLKGGITAWRQANMPLV